MSALEEITSWKRRNESDNGFSKNKHRDGSNLLEDHYSEIVEALEIKESMERMIEGGASIEIRQN
jgi:hypothetical protein